MLFKDLTGEMLGENIKKLKDGIGYSWMPYDSFHFIFPKGKKEILLKKEYKAGKKEGVHTEVTKSLRRNSKAMQRMHDKLRENGLQGIFYNSDNASFKLHLNLNNIGELDENIIFGLLKLLADEADSPDNNINFNFKIIGPELHSDERFKDTDQITIYFDKYSSTGDLIKLSEKVDAFLKANGVKENTVTLGPKESFGFNSFVSARFDTNKLGYQYDVYTFFDLELEKFFNAHDPKELESLPLCALEAVFNKIMFSETINNLKQDGFTGLTPEDSDLVQIEFQLMLANPEEYIRSAVNSWEDRFRDLKYELAGKLHRGLTFVSGQFNLNWPKTIHDDEVQISSEQNRFAELDPAEPFFKEDLDKRPKMVKLRKAVKEDLNKDPKIIRLRKALDEMTRYGNKLESEKTDELAIQKSKAAIQLANHLKNQLNEFIDKEDYSKEAYIAFESQFKKSMDDPYTQDLLRQHRNFNNVIIANVLIALTLVGTLFLIGQLAYSYLTTGKASGFFASTKGEQRLIEIEAQMNTLDISIIAVRPAR